MRTLILALVLFGSSAFAAPKYLKIDLRGDFRDDSVNLYPDGTPVYDGVDILVPATGRAFTSRIEVTGEGTCKLLRRTTTGRSTTVRVSADLEVDDGACDITIRLRDGRQATVNVHYVGT